MLSAIGTAPRGQSSAHAHAVFPGMLRPPSDSALLVPYRPAPRHGVIAYSLMGDRYEEEGNGPNYRWGDYSASFALPTGEIWSATEFIGDNARTTFANWSTFAWPWP